MYVASLSSAWCNLYHNLLLFFWIKLTFIRRLLLLIEVHMPLGVSSYGQLHSYVLLAYIRSCKSMDARDFKRDCPTNYSYYNQQLGRGTGQENMFCWVSSANPIYYYLRESQVYCSGTYKNLCLHGYVKLSTFLTLDPHAQRGLQYLVCPRVCPPVTTFSATTRNKQVK